MIKSEKNLIVGLDIGTSFIKAIVGIINEDNEIDFLGVGRSKSLGMKRGVVIDISATVQSIEKSVEEAELVCGYKITSAFVSISGKHIQSFNATGRAAISDNKEVSEQDLKSVEESAKAITLSNDQEILHVLPKDYEIDGQDGIKVPLGMSGIALDGRYHLITGAKNARDNIDKLSQKYWQKPYPFPVQTERIVLVIKPEKEVLFNLKDEDFEEKIGRYLRLKKFRN